MIDGRAYELLCCQLGLANEEKAGLRKQVNELIARYAHKIICVHEERYRQILDRV